MALLEHSPIPKTPGRFVWHFLDRRFFLISTLFIAILIISITIENSVSIFLGRFIDSLQYGKDQDAIIALGIVLGCSLGWRMLGILLSYLDMRLRWLNPARTAIQLSLFDWALGHSAHFYRTHFSGEIAAKIQKAAETTMILVHVTMYTWIVLFLSFIVGTIFLSRISWWYPLIIFIWAVIFIATSFPFLKNCFHLSGTSSDKNSKITARLIDVLSNINAVFSFTSEAKEHRVMRFSVNRAWFAFKDYRISIVKTRLIESLFITVLLGILLSLVAWQALHHEISVGDIVVVLGLCTNMISIVQRASEQLIAFFDNSGALKNSIDLILKPHDMPDPQNAIPLLASKGAIRFDNISFSFNEQKVLFNGLSLTIKAGERVGIVGPSGSGKSSLLRLLRREYHLQSGSISIDGVDINTITIDSLRKTLSEVPQDSSLFHRTIQNNIQYSDETLPLDATIDAAKKSHCHDFIQKKKGHYHALVGNRGEQLSGGERQRLLIARTFLKEAPILLLDEATSALDSKTEMAIQQSLDQLMEGKTVLAIAHRLSTLANMDRIIVLKDGQIIEEGTHSVLLKKQGTYAELWSHQNHGFIEDIEDDI